MPRERQVQSLERQRARASGLFLAVGNSAILHPDVNPMSSPSLRLVPSKTATQHHVSKPREEREPGQSRGSMIAMGLLAAAAPLLWIGHAIVHHLHAR